MPTATERSTMIDNHIDEQLRAAGPPGLDGTYRDTCIACLGATDTALGVRGEREWHAAFLHVLGVPIDQAFTTLKVALADAAGGPVDDRGRFEALYRVCRSCAAAANGRLPEPVLVVPGAEVPAITQP